MPAAQVLDDLTSNKAKIDDSLIWQRWIEPSVLCNPKGEYYFDIRIYVIAGKAIGGFARRAAAPKNKTFNNSPLSWLTTTGPLLPLTNNSSVSVKDSVGLSTSQIESLLELSAKIIRHLDEVGYRMDYSQTCEQIPGFSKLAGINDDLKFVNLKANRTVE